MRTVGRRVLYVFFFFAVSWWFFPTPVYAFQCRITFFPEATIVIAKVQRRELHCETHDASYTFNTILTLNGAVDKTFRVITRTRNDECPAAKTTTEIIPIFASDWGGLPIPSFTTGSTYLLAVDPTDEAGTYVLPLCGRIIEEVRGVFDVRVLMQFLKILFQPIWAAGFWGVIFLGLLLPKETPFALIVTIAVGIYGVVLYGLFGGIRFLVKRYKRRKG